MNYICCMDLKEKIEKSGLRAYDIHKMSDKAVSVGQASRWLKRGKAAQSIPVSVKMLLWRLCDEKIVQPPKVEARKEIISDQQSAKSESEKEWPSAIPVISRSYGEKTVREVGDFWFLEYGGTGWKLPKSRKAEKVQLGKDLVKWSEFKMI